MTIAHKYCIILATIDNSTLLLSQKVFYMTAVGGSSQCPTGRSDEVYARSPGGTEWQLLTELAQKVFFQSSHEQLCILFYVTCRTRNVSTWKAS